MFMSQLRREIMSVNSTDAEKSVEEQHLLWRGRKQSDRNEIAQQRQCALPIGELTYLGQSVREEALDGRLTAQFRQEETA